MMLNANILSIVFVSSSWKSWKKNFSFEKKSFFQDAISKNIAAYSDRDKWLLDQSKRACLFLILKKKFEDVLIFEEKCVYIRKAMCDY
jgi:hypothetical protein